MIKCKSMCNVSSRRSRHIYMMNFFLNFLLSSNTLHGIILMNKRLYTTTNKFKPWLSSNVTWKMLGNEFSIEDTLFLWNVPQFDVSLLIKKIIIKNFCWRQRRCSWKLLHKKTQPTPIWAVYEFVLIFLLVNAEVYVNIDQCIH